MNQFIERLATLGLGLCLSLPLTAQTMRTHKVKKSETIYGIAHQYGLSEDELRSANPEMQAPDYVLKKGHTIQVPVLDVQKSVRLGVMLPLNNADADGLHMLEYYRGVLMACDDMKRRGLNIDVYAWNVPSAADPGVALADPNAARCQLIMGPGYAHQLAPLMAFAEQHNALLAAVGPMSVPSLAQHATTFQLYQEPSELTSATVRRLMQWFNGYHVVVVDGADAATTKGAFTQTLRSQLEAQQTLTYRLTSLYSSDADFASAFSPQMPNLVVLNTASQAQLQQLFSKLDGLGRTAPGVRLSVFGYEEWMDYGSLQEQFHRNDVYIPATFYTNLQTEATAQLAQRYRSAFGTDMYPALPRYALQGYDHAMYFLTGLSRYGIHFRGRAGSMGVQPVQTPLRFRQAGQGGMENQAYMFIHYKADHTIDAINY